METLKVGIREFRENLAAYLESESPLAVTRHGETIGVYVPTRRKPVNHDWTALKSAADKLHAMMEAAGVTEDELVEDFKKARREARKR
jgi:antitoxin (DNA-binding transcriptional repressor) of toxin-antitoxin stability system